MADKTLLNQIRESNKSFLAGRPCLLDRSGEPFLVIACIDPRLTGLLQTALGLPQYRASVIRIAGNRIARSSSDVFRSVAAAIYLKRCKEIVIVGHTDCALATFSSAQVIEQFRSAGIPRSAFGDGDLREWFGAFNDIAENVRDGIENLRSSGVVPAAVKIHGAIIDISSGEVTVVHDGDMLTGHRATRPPAEVTAPGPAAAMSADLHGANAATTPASAPAPPQLQGTVKGPIVIPMTAGTGQSKIVPPASMTEAITILGDFFSRESQNPKLRGDLVNLRNFMKSERNPGRILGTLERLVREHVSRYPRVPGALEFLRKQIDSKNTLGEKVVEMLRLIVETS